ncbi:hypothetical protein TKK_0013670 [Trichogramma kaykai]
MAAQQPKRATREQSKTSRKGADPSRPKMAAQRPKRTKSEPSKTSRRGADPSLRKMAAEPRKSRPDCCVTLMEMMCKPVQR